MAYGWFLMITMCMSFLLSFIWSYLKHKLDAIKLNIKWVFWIILRDVFCFWIVGVSCDSCLKSNFRGKRYKCLICYDYDLCATCYEAGATTTRHTTDHPVQCIITRSDFGKSSSFSFKWCKNLISNVLNILLED